MKRKVGLLFILMLSCILAAYTAEARSNENFLPVPVNGLGSSAYRNITGISIEKSICVDCGTTCVDTPPCPSVQKGTDLCFKLKVTNTGCIKLTDINLTDTDFDVSGCSIPASLAPGASFSCVVGPVPAYRGEHTNTSKVTAKVFYKKCRKSVCSSDSACYFGVAPGISIEKLPPIRQVPSGSDVTFTIVVTNTGNVPLTDVTVTDLKIPACNADLGTLDPGQSKEYTCKALDVTENICCNIASVEGTPPVGPHVTDIAVACVEVVSPEAICTYTQGGWGNPGAPGQILIECFTTAYPAGVIIGDTSCFTLKFTSAAAVQAFLPQGGPSGPLTQSDVDPTTSSAGVFAGQVLALRLNVDLTADCSPNNAFANLTLCNTGTSLDGKTVAQVLAAANKALGCDTLPDGFTQFSQLNEIIDLLNKSFDNCIESSWAMGHLCPP